MLLFWLIAISAFWTYPQLVPLVLAVGMSILWPVMGWIYGRTAIFTTHAVVRAVVCSVLWNWVPSSRFTLLPLSVSAFYLVMVGAIFVASSPARQKARLEDVTRDSEARRGRVSTNAHYRNQSRMRSQKKSCDIGREMADIGAKAIQ